MALLPGAALTPTSSAYSTVAANSVDSVKPTAPGTNFWVTNRSSADLWVRTDGADPTPETDGSRLILAGQARRFMAVAMPPEVRVAATAPASYGVEFE